MTNCFDNAEKDSLDVLALSRRNRFERSHQPRVESKGERKDKTKNKNKKGLSFYQIANVCTYTSMSNTLPNGSVWTDFSME